MHGTWRSCPFPMVGLLLTSSIFRPDCSPQAVFALRGARMHTAVVPVPAMPSAFTRWIVGLLVVGHFFAIFIAVTSDSSPNYPAPQLAVRASSLLQPYLQATF